MANPARTIIGDGGDPSGQAWLIAWNGHAVRHGLGGLWNTNAFYPETYGLAFTDSLLGYAPAGLFGSGPDDAILRYNILFVLAFALAYLGGYALVRQLGANRIGAAVAGAVFAFAPWRYGHDGHLNILSTGGIALAVAMLARGHGWSLTQGYRPRRVRPGWALAGWLVAAWQITLGFGIGLPFAYLLAAACLAAVAGWLLTGRPALDRRLILADVAGGLAFAAVTGYLAQIYLRVRELHPETPRSWEYVALFSPTWRGLLAQPAPVAALGRLARAGPGRDGQRPEREGPALRLRAVRAGRRRPVRLDLDRAAAGAARRRHRGRCPARAGHQRPAVPVPLPLPARLRRHPYPRPADPVADPAARRPGRGPDHPPEPPGRRGHRARARPSRRPGRHRAPADRGPLRGHAGAGSRGPARRTRGAGRGASPADRAAVRRGNRSQHRAVVHRRFSHNGQRRREHQHPPTTRRSAT
nr:hypothetical protein GCM10020092_101570 [Actinoplanes digitatis]